MIRARRLLSTTVAASSGHVARSSRPATLRLNHAQKAAVHARDEHLLLVAGPATGKSTVLAHRAARLALRQRRRSDSKAAQPGSVLLLAAEERETAGLQAALAECGEQAGEDVRVSSVDSLIMDDMMARAAPQLLEDGRRVASDADLRALLVDNFSDLPLRRLRGAFTQNALQPALHSAFASLQLYGVSSDAYSAFLSELPADSRPPAFMQVQRELAACYAFFTAQLEQQRIVSRAALQAEFAASLMSDGSEGGDALPAEAALMLDERVAHIVIDDLQQLTPVQWRLLSTMQQAGAASKQLRSISAAVDDDQSVRAAAGDYVWAVDEWMQRFPTGKVLAGLPYQFRQTHWLNACGRKLILRNRDRAEYKLGHSLQASNPIEDRGGKPRSPRPRSEEERVVAAAAAEEAAEAEAAASETIHLSPQEEAAYPTIAAWSNKVPPAPLSYKGFPTLAEEMQGVADMARELAVVEDAKWSSIAIVCRRHWMKAVVSRAMADAAIPAVIASDAEAAAAAAAGSAESAESAAAAGDVVGAAAAADGEVVTILDMSDVKPAVFDSMFIVGATEYWLPGQYRPSVLRPPTELLPQPLRLPDIAAASPLSEAEAALEAERRQLYTAMSRASKRVVFTQATRYRGWTRHTSSRFISEALGTASNAASGRFVSHPAFQSLLNNEPTDIGQLLGRDGALRLSFSRINEYQRCPLSFFYRHVMRLPTTRTLPMIGGSCLHHALDKYLHARLRGRQPTFGALVKWYHEEWPQDVPPARATMAQVQNGVQMLASFHERTATSDKLPQLVERHFQVPLLDGKVLLSGAWDRVDEDEDGEIIVIDYKSRVGEEHTPAQVLQLQLYAVAYKEIYGRLPQKLVLEEISSGHRLTFAASQEDCDAALQLLSSTADAVLARSFPPKPDPRQCSFCLFRTMCHHAQ